MIVSFTETEQMIADAAKKLLARKTAGDALWPRLADAGWLAVTLPEAVGGSEGSLVDAGLVAVELGRAGHFSGYADTVALATALANVDSNTVTALLSDVAAGAVELLFVQDTVAGGSDSAKGVVFPGGAKRAFAVAHRKDAGTLVATPLDDVVGRPVKTTARGAEIRVEAAGTSKGLVLAEGVAAEAAWTRATLIRRCLAAACLAGGIRTLIVLARDYSEVRKQFGHLIGSYQAVQHAIVDMLAGAEAAELLVFRALADLSTADAPGSVAPAVAFTREAAWNALIKAYDVLGGVGFIEEHPISLHTRGMLPLIAGFGPTARCEEDVAATVLPGHWLS